MRPASPEFIRVVEAALSTARSARDDAVQYMATTIPIYVQYEATREQAKAAGCATCEYRGLWAPSWPEFERSEHGIIWVFESGIRDVVQKTSRNLTQEALNTLLHEFDHALQKDHVLDAVERRTRALRLLGRVGGCGSC